MLRVCALVVAALLALAPTSALAADRIVAILSDQNIYVKDGPVNAGWHQTTTLPPGVTVSDLELSNNWITNLIANGANPGELSVKRPGWNSPWLMMAWGAPAITQFKVSHLSDGNFRVLALRGDGTVVMKDGDWNSGWWSGTLNLPPGAVTSLVVGGDNIGVVMNTGGLNYSFYAKQLTPGAFSHPNNVGWTTVAIYARFAAMTNDRVAYVDNSGYVFAKTGGITGQWFNSQQPIYDNVSALRLAGTRMCVVKNDNSSECKEGGLSAGSVPMYSGVSDIQVTSDRVGVLTTSKSAYVLEGTLKNDPSAWTAIAVGNAIQIALVSY